MKLTDLMGFGFEIVMIDSDGTARHLTTTEDVDAEIERRGEAK